MSEGPRVVVAHDFMLTYGGAERVTEDLAREFRDAMVVSILGRPSVAVRMGVHDRWSTVLRPRELLVRHYRVLAPLMPTMVRQATLPPADLILSSSYAFAHHFTTPNAAPHVCYCHSPLRFAWTMADDYRRERARHGLEGAAFDVLAAHMRRLDRRAAAGVTTYLTQSPYTAQLIERFYGRSARIVGAPIDCETFRPPEDRSYESYALFCGRLVEPYKRARLAIEAFRELDRPLLIAGDGPAMPELRTNAPANVRFLGHLTDEELVPVMQRAAFVLFPSLDDFGLIPLEAMACGRPVLAYGAGGALHTVMPGVTGEHFAEQSVQSLTEALLAFDPDAYDPDALRRHARQWDSQSFRGRVREAVNDVLAGQTDAGAHKTAAVSAGGLRE